MAEDAHLHQGHPMALTGLAYTGEAGVVLLPADTASHEQLVAQRLRDLIGRGEDDLATVQKDTLDDLTTAALHDTRRPIAMDGDEDLRQRSLREVRVVERYGWMG